jgi:PAT family beta-lactamase induction signal transducer AmpG
VALIKKLPVKEHPDFRQVIKLLLDKRILGIFFLGFISGFPWVLHGSVMTLWLKAEGLSRGSIGFIGIVGIAYAFNFTWAPLLDRIRIPLLHKLLDQRRSWILCCVSIIALCTFAMSFAKPDENLFLVGVIALCIAIASATQDVAIDAYRIDVFAESEVDKMPYAAAATTGGWWAGYGFIGGALALHLGGESIGFSWPVVYTIMSIVCIVQIIGLFFLPKVVTDSSSLLSQSDAQIQNTISPVNKISTWFENTLIAPFREFFTRCGFELALGLLLFVFTFKMGEAFLGRMSILFYKEVGFTTDQIGFYSKLIGGLLTAVFAFLGAMINTRFGLIRGLMIGGIAMASTNLLFALMSVVGPDTRLFALTMVLDNFTAAFATVAFVAFISYFTSRTHTATQYALLASLGNFGRTSVSSGSGYVVDAMNGNWFWFFILTSLMVIPALLILVWIANKLKQNPNFDNSVF